MFVSVRNDLNPLAQFSREQRTLKVVGKSWVIWFCDRSVLALCLMLFHTDNVRNKQFLISIHLSLTHLSSCLCAEMQKQ